MTTQYNTKEQALDYALYYAGFNDEKLRKEKLAQILGLPSKPIELGWPHVDPEELQRLGHNCKLEDISKLPGKKLDSYQFGNPKDEEVMIGIGIFRDGFDLWLFNPKTGCGIRT